MDDYPDPDEEYELMYADELELLREEDNDSGGNVAKKKSLPAKRSLDFSSPVSKPVAVSKVPNSVSSLTSSQISLTPDLQSVDEVLTPVNTSNKRTADELFGDIADIDFDSLELPSKRQKTQEENDLELIHKILESRRLKQSLLDPNRVLNESKSAFKVKDNISINIPRWAFVPLTNSDGDRIYVRLESEEFWEKSLDAGVEKMSLHSTYSSTWEEARKIIETKQKQAAQELVTTQPLPDMDVVTGTLLWVDKYRPRSYLDLLSEEPVNRALLHWLHLWDKIVFKKEVKTKDPQQRNTFVKRTGQFQLTNKWRGKKEAEPEMDEDGRPHHKVALLCGPPGVGKTTLAHLLAKIAGYRPVEINASDERSTEAFRTALLSATQMRSVIDLDRRPNCLILDEIDGAPLPTVELLVKWCLATGGEGKKSKTQPLRRPVIAICNDVYATSLRPLRPVALVLPVGGVSLPRLSARLSLVALQEGMYLSPRVMTSLAARAQGDVRQAIQLMGFVKGRDRAELTLEDVENFAIGTKDCNRSVMQALNAVFTINDKDSQPALKIIQSAGEYDRIVDGIFENYLTARVDSRLLLACETLSWLRVYDTVQSWTMRHQNYSLYGMLPLCIMRCHSVLATRGSHKLRFPTQAQEMHRKKSEIDSIVTSVWRGSGANVTSNRRSLQLDILPLLPYLLSPTLRSANIQLCSETERKSLECCAGAMCDYGLQYVQQRTPEGVYAYQLEPDIYKQAFFGNEERVRPPPAVRQAISRQQQLEIIRRNEEMAGRVCSRKPDDAQSKSSKVKAKEVELKQPGEAPLPNHLQRLQPKKIERSVPQVHKDFFGRIVPLSQIQRSEPLPDVISSSSVFYQYQEGFNNAVRRNVRTKDML